jgi:hypothetical protein
MTETQMITTASVIENLLRRRYVCLPATLDPRADLCITPGG